MCEKCGKQTNSDAGFGRPDAAMENSCQKTTNPKKKEVFNVRKPSSTTTITTSSHATSRRNRPGQRKYPGDKGSLFLVYPDILWSAKF